MNVFLAVGQRFIVWVTAILASIQPRFRALQELLDRQLEHFVLWLCAYVLVLGFAAFAEKAKAFQGG